MVRHAGVVQGPGGQRRSMGSPVLRVSTTTAEGTTTSGFGVNLHAFSFGKILIFHMKSMKKKDKLNFVKKTASKGIFKKVKTIYRMGRRICKSCKGPRLGSKQPSLKVRTHSQESSSVAQRLPGKRGVMSLRSAWAAR